MTPLRQKKWASLKSWAMAATVLAAAVTAGCSSSTKSATPTTTSTTSAPAATSTSAVPAATSVGAQVAAVTADLDAVDNSLKTVDDESAAVDRGLTTDEGDLGK